MHSGVLGADVRTMPDLASIKEQYLALKLIGDNSPQKERINRGFKFERLLHELFKSEGLEPRTSFKNEGEQIDGSLLFNGTFFLLEAKWQQKELPASALYQFKGKVDGKLVGTLGIFISMSGYSSDAVDALALGKSLNLILFDKDDMDAAIIDGIGFSAILKQKMRHAAEDGAVYFPSKAEVISRSATTSVEIETLHFDAITNTVIAPALLESLPNDIIIVCEGDTDRVVLSNLAERIIESENSARTVKIVVALGKLAVPKIANALWARHRNAAKAILVLDGDGDPAGSLELLTKQLEFSGWTSAIPNPSIEEWLKSTESLISKPLKKNTENYRLAAKLIDLKKLRQQDEEFKKFYDAIIGD